MFDISAGIESENLRQGPDSRTVKMRTMNNLLAPILVVSAMVKDQVGYQVGWILSPVSNKFLC